LEEGEESATSQQVVEKERRGFTIYSYLLDRRKEEREEKKKYRTKKSGNADLYSLQV